jgi:hypothetical protein
MIVVTVGVSIAIPQVPVSTIALRCASEYAMGPQLERIGSHKGGNNYENVNYRMDHPEIDHEELTLCRGLASRLDSI